MTVNDLIYRVVRPLGGLKVAKYLSRRHPRILMYHRINDGSSAEGISVDSLRWQLKQIKENFRVLPLDEMVEASTQNSLPDNAVALTFDDGYRDFYDHAYPLLKEFELPATLFLTTGFVNGDLWLWPDKIKYILSKTKHDFLDIEEIRTPLRSEFEDYHAWNELGDICLNLTNAEKFLLIERLAHKLNVKLPDKAPEGYEGLSWQLVREMLKNSQLSLGSHSVSHPVMTRLGDDELNYELLASKETIELETGMVVKAFCYPNGQPADINDETRRAVQSTGYAYALAAYQTRQPLRDRWAIARYSGASKTSDFEKSIYGLTYLRTRDDSF
jgi:peptidoglycan/xylan/chitin deacetylase (PgdA/CDA1 family)